MKKIISIILTAVLVCSVAVYASALPGTVGITGESVTIDDLALLPDGEAAKVYENQGMKLFIPLEYDELLLVELPKEKDVFFSVAEKASVEAANGEEGAGSLFRITRVSEAQAQEMRCYDMSSREIFARDADDNFYVYNHPTDVRFVRESYENIEEDMEQWRKLNEWAWNDVRESFVAVNEGLTAVTYGNSDLDIFLARIAFRDDVTYTVSTTEFGPKEPGDVDPTPYLERLMEGVQYETADIEETPDGEYVVLNFPEEGYRFDFFLMEGKENCIRQVWGEDYELLYQARFADDTLKASEIMNEWYDALVADEGS